LILKRKNLEFHVLPLGPLATNTVFVLHPTLEGVRALLWDPGYDPAGLASFVISREAILERIFLTHAHLDHCLALPGLMQHLQEPLPEVVLHRGDQWLYENQGEQGRYLGVSVPQNYPEVTWLDRVMEWEWYGCRIQILHTPGHSPGSVCYYFMNEGVLLSGDLLFAGAVGRTDLWQGSSEQLMQSLRLLKKRVAKGCEIIPGHGPMTTLESEMRSNPFLAFE